jgi:hypothetical protein
MNVSLPSRWNSALSALTWVALLVAIAFLLIYSCGAPEQQAGREAPGQPSAPL